MYSPVLFIIGWAIAPCTHRIDAPVYIYIKRVPPIPSTCVGTGRSIKNLKMGHLLPQYSTEMPMQTSDTQGTYGRSLLDGGP